MLRRHLLLSLPAIAGLAACDEPPDAQADARDRLVGTWLREFEEGGFKVRRVLVLQPQGKFHETTKVTDAQGTQKQATSEGDWFFDGTNFKRKYTFVDSRQMSGGRITFATFEVKFPSRGEFVGVDNVHKLTVAYHRVDEGTQP